MSRHEGPSVQQRQGPGQAPECARLAEALRELRGRTGLSLAALATKTTFSKSSWERYLNGRKLPPRSAVEALARMAGEPPTRYLALWELAEVAWSGRGARPRPTVMEPEPEPAPAPWWRRHPLAAAAAAGIATCAVAVGSAVAFWPAGEPDASPSQFRTAPVRQVLCHGAECTGDQPLASGCGDVEVQGAPKVLRTLKKSGVEVEIRYKPECGAAWLRVSGQRIGDRFEVSAPGAATQRLVIASKYETGMLRSSPMVAVREGDVTTVKACAEFAGSGERECFQP